MLKYSSGGHAVTGGPESFTFSFIKGIYFVLILFAGIGFILACMKFLLDHRPQLYQRLGVEPLVQRLGWKQVLPSEYLFLSAGGFSLYLLAFAPVSAIGIGRIYILAFPLVSPLAVLGFNHISRFLTPSRVNANLILCVGLLLMILVNSGTVAALTTNNASPQPQLIEEENEHIDSLSRLSIYHQYYLVHDVQASTWILEHRSPDSRIYGSIMGLGLKGWYSDYSDWNYQALPANFSEKKSGYLYLGGFTVDTNQVLIGRGYSSTNTSAYEYVKLGGIRERHVIYTTSETRIVYVDGELAAN